MFDLAEVLNDPDLAQPFEIVRSSGSFQLGGFKTTSTTVQGYGVVADATEEQLRQVPEADRVTGAKAFYSTQPIYRTHSDGTPGTSDVLQWNGEQWRVSAATPMVGGFYLAIALRIPG